MLTITSDMWANPTKIRRRFILHDAIFSNGFCGALTLLGLIWAAYSYRDFLPVYVYDFLWLNLIFYVLLIPFASFRITYYWLATTMWVVLFSFIAYLLTVCIIFDNSQSLLNQHLALGISSPWRWIFSIADIGSSLFIVWHMYQKFDFDKFNQEALDSTGVNKDLRIALNDLSFKMDFIHEKAKPTDSKFNAFEYFILRLLGVLAPINIALLVVSKDYCASVIILGTFFSGPLMLYVAISPFSYYRAYKSAERQLGIKLRPGSLGLKDDADN